MKQLKFSFIAITALFSALVSNAQNVDEIISKNIEAMGGKDKISQVNSVKIESAMQAMGNESLTTTTILNGKGFKTESEMMGSKMVQVVTDNGGWMINPMMGAGTPTPMEDAQFKSGADQIFIGGNLFEYASKGNKVELLGQEKIGDINAYKIKLTNTDNIETIYYLDPSTYYIIQTVKHLNMMGQELDLTVSFSDYKKTDAGIVMAYKTELNYGGQFSLTSEIKTIEINKTIDPAIFEMPK